MRMQSPKAVPSLLLLFFFFFFCCCCCKAQRQPLNWNNKTEILRRAYRLRAGAQFQTQRNETKRNQRNENSSLAASSAERRMLQAAAAAAAGAGAKIGFRRESHRTGTRPVARRDRLTFRDLLRGQERLGYHHMFSFYADDTRDSEYCRAFLANKESYCRRHGLLWSFRRSFLLPQRHVQESSALKTSIASELLLSAHNQQVTYLDLDTFIVDHAVEFGGIFDKADREHPSFPCTVYVESDPYFVNSGFFSVMNTAWVREEFLPKWDSLRRSWERSAMWGRQATGSINAGEPDQKALNAALLHFALRERGFPDGDICGFAEHDLKSPKVRNATEQVRKWIKSLSVGFPGVDYYVRVKNPVVGLDKDQTSYAALFAKSEKSGEQPGGGYGLGASVFYECFNWAFQEVLGLDFRGRSFPVGEEDGVCFLGFDGLQVNRHHFLPKEAVGKLRRFTYSESDEKRHHARLYGPGYSRDLFNIHAQLQKNDPAFCSSTLAANDHLSNLSRASGRSFSMRGGGHGGGGGGGGGGGASAS